MTKKTDENKLKPGEKKILEALRDGPKSFGEMAINRKYLKICPNSKCGEKNKKKANYCETCGTDLRDIPVEESQDNENGILDVSILSSYLKSLQTKKPQRKNLIMYDFKTRKYKILDESLDILFLEDMISVLQDTVARRVREDTKDYLIGKQHFVFCPSIPDFEKRLDDILQKGEPSNLTDLNIRFFDEWTNYVLETVFPENGNHTQVKKAQEKRAVVHKYREYLLTIVRKVDSGETDEKAIREFAETLIRLGYANMNISVPEEIIKKETEEHSKKLIEARNIILQPEDIEDLQKRLEILYSFGRKKVFTQKDIEKIEPMLDFLDNPKNEKIYKTFREKHSASPKVLIVEPSMAFCGYMNQLREINPEKAQVVEWQMREDQIAVLKELLKR